VRATEFGYREPPIASFITAGEATVNQFLRQEFLEPTSLSNTHYAEILEPERSLIRSKVHGRFSDNNEYLRPLYDHLVDKCSFQVSDSWKLLGEFLGASSSIVFFDANDDPSVFKISELP